MSDPLTGTLAALREGMRRLLMESVEFLSKTSLQVRPVMFPDFGPEGPMRGAHSREVLDAMWTAMAVRRAWEAWPDLQHVFSIVKSDSTLSRIILTDRNSQQIANEPWAVGSAMSQFLLHYLDTLSIREPKWDERTFDKLFEVFSDSIRLGSYRLSFWTALYNCYLSGVPEPVEMAAGISLLDPDDRTRGSLLPTFTIDNPLFDAPRYYIRADDRVSFHGFPSQTTQLASSRVVVAVRLAVGGNAYIRQTRALPEPGSCLPMDAFGGLATGYQPFSGAFLTDNPSQIRAQDVDSIKALIDAVPKLNEEFPIALSRYTSTTERANRDDRLIDASIGLENLLLQGIRDELSFRLALRGAWLLAETTSARRAEFAQLKKVYDARSSLVHGSVPVTGEPDIIPAAVDTLRRLLLKIAQSDLDAMQLKSRLDSLVFGDNDS